jgi:hypothetical protein
VYHKSSERRRAASPFLMAHPPPPPAQWFADETVKSTELVVVPVDRDGLGSAIRSKLPARPLTPYPVAAPFVSTARIRLVVGALIVDLDPAKLEAAR